MEHLSCRAAGTAVSGSEGRQRGASLRERDRRRPYGTANSNKHAPVADGRKGNIGQSLSDLSELLSETPALLSLPVPESHDSGSETLCSTSNQE
jgi:hypothetical protein